eukprot:gene1873-biopygen1249
MVVVVVGGGGGGGSGGDGGGGVCSRRPEAFLNIHHHHHHHHTSPHYVQEGPGEGGFLNIHHEVRRRDMEHIDPNQKMKSMYHRSCRSRSAISALKENRSAGSAYQEQTGRQLRFQLDSGR